VNVSSLRRVLASAGVGALVALSLGVMPVMAAVPPNDNFANARPIASLPAVITGNNADATTQSLDPASECTTSERTTWYRLTLPNAAYVLVDTHGGQHDTGVSIWRGSSFATLSEVACSYGSEGEPGGVFFGRVTFKASADVRYYIRLNAGDSGPTAGGATRLSVRKVTPPANDDAANATRIQSLPFSTTTSNTRATTQAGERKTGPCFIAMATVWYSVRPASAVTLRADTLGTKFDTVVGVLQGGPSLSDMSYVGCDDDTESGGLAVYQSSVTWKARAGQTYWIQAGGYDNENGSLHLHVQQVTPPANDDRQNAKVVPNVNVTPFNTTVSTRNATPQQGETIIAHCAKSDDRQYPQSVWYRYTAPNTDGVKFVVTTTDNRLPVLSVYLGSSFSNQQAVVCNTNGTAVLEPQAGKTYYLQLAGPTGRSGTYKLTIEPEH
jgi:hypothetical protein